MPEYLSPGVYIEEIPARLKAIEGVSTSTAGLVGAAERGPVPGYPLPFVPPAGFALPTDGGPMLVTSFGAFSQTFGAALSLVTNPAHAYLARAVRMFFDNGGRRCYITRVAPATATRASVRVAQGQVLRLNRRAAAGDTVVYFTTLRNINDDAANNALQFFRADGSAIGPVSAVAGWNTPLRQVTLTAALGTDLEPDAVFAVAIGANPVANAGPAFIARSPGAWGNDLRITISNYDGPAVSPTGPALAAATLVSLRSAASFYAGAIIEVDHGSPTNPVAAVAHQYYEVATVLPGNVIQLTTPLVADLPAAGWVRVVGINITLELRGPAPVLETYLGLTWNPGANAVDRHYATVLNTSSTLVYVQPPGVGGLGGAESSAITAQPTTTNGFFVQPTTLGDDQLGALGDADYIGTDFGPGQRTGLASLQDVDDVSIVAVPGQTGIGVQQAMITQCEVLRYRFAVLDGQAQPTPPAIVNQILAHRNSYDSSYAGYYVPWVQVEENDQTVLLPPSGFMAGIYARTDNDRGVWKAPANETVRDAIGLQFYITTGEQDILNPAGVNVIRQFEGRGIRIWGARTSSSDPEDRYINVRRYLIFLEKSIDRGTQWVVFEPNSPETWSRVVDSVTAFLHSQWRDGALLGRKPEDAFYVRCDETTMTVDDILNGRLICDIGVAIVRPAEFVIFRIEQIAGLGLQP